MLHYVVERPADDSRRRESVPIAHGATEGEAAAALSRYLGGQPEAVAIRLRRNAKLERCNCHPSHIKESL